MSLHDLPPPRKPNRLGLYLPFGLLLLAMAAWTVFWIYARSEVRLRMDASVRDLRAAGYDISWKDRSLGGYPFRMDVTLTDVSVREPGGWALQAPDLEGEAFVYAPGTWLIAAPHGLTFVRPVGGPVTMNGDLIRASLSHLGQRPPSLSFEGVKVTFQPQAGAEPFALSAADRVEFHLRAGPDDEGGVFGRVDNGSARLSGLFARVAQGKPISIVWNSTLSKMSAFQGADWPSAVRHWSDAGGQMTVRDASLTAGDALISARNSQLGVGRDGRLTGALDATLRQAPRALGAMGDTGVLPPETAGAAAAVAQARQGDGDAAHVTLTFQAGQTTLGPVAIAPAPRVYQAD